MENTNQEIRNEIYSLLEEAQLMSGFGHFLGWIGQKIEKVGKRKKKPSEIFSAIAFYFLITTISALLILMFDKNDSKALLEHIGTSFLLNILTVVLFVGLLRLNFYSSFTSLREFFVETLGSADDLMDFQIWLKNLLDYRKQIVFSIVFGLSSGIFLPPYIGNLFGFSSLGFSFYFGSLSFFSGFAMYTIYLSIFFPLRIRNYKYKIYYADPGKSTFIIQLSRVLNRTVFVFAFLTLFMILISMFYQVGTDLVVQLIFILLAWVPITVMFVMNQFGLSRIIARAKTKKLSEIELEIAKLEAANDFTKKEILESINHLMDFHERVQKSNNSSLDFRAILSYLNSLLIPALGFLIDTLVKLFTRNP